MKKGIKRFLTFMVLMCLCFGTAKAEIGLLESIMASRVKYIADRQFYFDKENDEYIIFFSFMDANKKRIKAPAIIDVRIKGEDGNVLFEGSKRIITAEFSKWTNLLKGERLLAAIKIDKEKIKKTETGKGTVSFHVYLDGYFEFSEYEIQTDELPKVPYNEVYKIYLPSLPQTVAEYVSYQNTKVSEAEITEIRYEIEEWLGDPIINVYFTGEKTYDYKGESNNDSCWIGWKLYDEEGFVVKSGGVVTQDLKTGEKFKDADKTFYELKPGTYRLELTDVK